MNGAWPTRTSRVRCSAPCATGTHVCLIGDPNQLCPVGHGKPLADMLAAEVPTAALTEIHRNSGLITETCQNIVAGRHPAPAQRLCIEEGVNLKIIECATPERQIEALTAVIEAMRKKGGIAMKTDMQVLCPLNDSSLISRKPLNKLLQAMLNGEHTTRGHGHVDEFFLHDRIICLSNSIMEGMSLYDTSAPYRVDSYVEGENSLYGGGTGVFIANGDQGYVKAIDQEKGTLIAEFQNPKRVGESETEEGRERERRRGQATARRPTSRSRMPSPGTNRKAVSGPM